MGPESESIVSDPTAADLDAVAAEEKAKEATSSGSKEAPSPAPIAPVTAPPKKEPDTNVTDSVGKPKEGGKPVPLGTRGVNAPRDSKPAPTDKDKRAAQPKITVTDTVDNAGKEKSSGQHLGIRGIHTVRDTYKL